MNERNDCDVRWKGGALAELGDLTAEIDSAKSTGGLRCYRIEIWRGDRRMDVATRMSLADARVVAEDLLRNVASRPQRR